MIREETKLNGRRHTGWQRSARGNGNATGGLVACSCGGLYSLVQNLWWSDKRSGQGDAGDYGNYGDGRQSTQWNSFGNMRLGWMEDERGKLERGNWVPSR